MGFFDEVKGRLIKEMANLIGDLVYWRAEVPEEERIKANIIVFGPVGQGKSSLINSMISLTHGSHQHLARAMNSSNRVTTGTGYFDGVDGFGFLDTQGAEEVNYLNSEFSLLLKGALPIGYDVSAGAEELSRAVKQHEDTASERKIHSCIFAVNQAFRYSSNSDPFIIKMKQFIVEARKVNLRPIIAVTKVDEVQDDELPRVKTDISSLLDFDINDIFLVSNPPSSISGNEKLELEEEKSIYQLLWRALENAKLFVKEDKDSGKERKVEEAKDISSKGSKKKKISVEYNGNVLALKVPLNSMEELVASLKVQLTITAGISLNYYNPAEDFDEVLMNLGSLPNEKPKIKVVSQSLRWWGWSPSGPTWTEKGQDSIRYYSLLVKEGSKVHHPETLEKFKLGAEHLGFGLDKVHKVYAIANSRLLSSFENCRDFIQARHRATPRLFKKDDWKTMPDAARRQHHLDLLFAEISKWEWNKNGSKPAVLPMIQGTTEEAAWSICEQGFGVVASTDPGYYGQGIYFTSKLNYANMYAKESGDQGKVFLLSAVVPGNVFPVTEHPFLPDKTINPNGLYAKPFRPGYQAHQALVDERNPSVEVFDDNKEDLRLADELVIFESAQAVPLFVFYMKSSEFPQ